MAGGTLELRVDAVGRDATVEGMWIGAGCLGATAGAELTPAAMQARPGTPGSILIIATIGMDRVPTNVRLGGDLELGVPGIDDDFAGGESSVTRIGTETGSGWSATHSSATAPPCPVLDVSTSALGLHYGVDSHRVLHQEPEATTELRVSTDIVAAAALVTLPDGGDLRLEPNTDIFSPSVDFVTEFQFVGQLVGPTSPGAVYGLVLLDALGRPIPGTERTEGWSGSCDLEPPRGLEFDLLDDGSARLTWEPSPPGVAFAPEFGIGFYQAQVRDATGTIVVGTKSIVAEHVLPWDDFGGEAVGVPTGVSYGSGLGDLPDGTYDIHVGVYSMVPDPEGADDYCRIEDRDEGLTITIVDGVLSIGG
jgi:hypothetical protein